MPNEAEYALSLELESLMRQAQILRTQLDAMYWRIADIRRKLDGLRAQPPRAEDH